MIPIKILPKEKLKLKVVYRGKERKKEESVLTCKIITGKISTREVKIPFSCEVVQCPLEFSCYKIDYPVLQIEENYLSNFEIKNVSHEEQVFEFFHLEYQISGLSILPLVHRLAPQQTV